MFERIIEELKGVEVEGLSRARLADACSAVSRVRGALDALEVRVAAAIDGLGDGGVGSESVMRRHGRVSKREAARRKRRADGLKLMPNTSKRLADGEISAEHADALARAAAATSEDDVDGDERLLDRAADRPADAAGKDIQDWVDRHQGGDDRADRHRRQRSRRSVSMFRGDDDMSVLLCRTDLVTGGQLRARIEARATELRRLDRKRQDRDGTVPRGWDHLRHDALMIDLGVDPRPTGDGDGPGRSGSLSASVRNQIVVVADAAALTGDRSASAAIPGVGAIPSGVLERLGCDADLFGHVFGADGVSLWHGRAIRTTSPQQWRSLVARDRGCVLCAAAPAYCEAHHVVPWAVGGRTDVENLVLLCTRHHHELHDHDQRLVPGPDGAWRIEPRAGPPPPSPRPPPRPPRVQHRAGPRRGHPRSGERRESGQPAAA